MVEVYSLMKVLILQSNNSLIANNFEYSEGSDYPIFNTDGYAAIELSNAIVELNYCTIANNQGSGILLRDGSNMNISNSIYWFNEPFVLNNNPDYELDTMYISYSNIENGYEGEDLGNISDNPLFCNLSIFDYSLAANSPCIAAGEGDSNIGAFNIDALSPIVNGFFLLVNQSFKYLEIMMNGIR